MLLFQNEERLTLLKEATKVHAFHSKECLTGNGVDRHLFVLHILSKITGIDSPFLDYYIAQPWELSTSQVISNKHISNSEKSDISDVFFHQIIKAKNYANTSYVKNCPLLDYNVVILYIN